MTALAPQTAFAAPVITLQNSFNGTNGATPFASLTAAGNGLFYGTTTEGGVTNQGTIFEFDSTTGLITRKVSFAGSNGANPVGALTAGGNGIYYGTTSYGGNNNQGAVFTFDSGSNALTLFSFAADGSQGSNPYASLTAAGNGVYYGTANRGGASGIGAVFQFDPTTGSITLQASLDGANGTNPYAPLTAAGNGLFYGTTTDGGAYGKGTIFQFDSTTSLITLQASFDGSNGSFPFAALTASGNGLYYGTTFGGGANDQGGVFAFDPAAGSITLKASFNGSNGARSAGALTAAGNGLYYGVTEEGGANNQGAIFAFDSLTGSITLKASFDGSNGNASDATLTAGENGLFYGATYFGGADGKGTIFAFDPGAPDPTPVPGPLPLIGAGAALGWSRRLRRRIRQVRGCPAAPAHGRWGREGVRARGWAE